MVMLGATLPGYDSDTDRKVGHRGQEVIDASDPKNRQRVKDFFNAVQ